MSALACPLRDVDWRVGWSHLSQSCNAQLRILYKFLLLLALWVRNNLQSEDAIYETLIHESDALYWVRDFFVNSLSILHLFFSPADTSFLPTPYVLLPIYWFPVLTLHQMS